MLSSIDNYLAYLVQRQPTSIWAQYSQREDMLSLLLFVILFSLGRNIASGQCVGIESSLFNSSYSHLSCTKEVVPEEEVPPGTFCTVRWVMVIFLSSSYCFVTLQCVQKFLSILTCLVSALYVDQSWNRLACWTTRSIGLLWCIKMHVIYSWHHLSMA